jgi:argininosuccinate lyase
VKLPTRFTAGSSMLPQKRNPDLFELARGRTAEADAALAEVLAITAKLTSGYHRDLQLIKKPLFRGLDAARDTTALMAFAVPGLEFDEAKLGAAIDPSMLAAERAYRLVQDEGLAFRDAYQRVREPR